MTQGPVQLGNLIAQDKLLWAYCRDCGHERDLIAETLLLDATTAVPDVAKRLICSMCRSRNITTRPELYPGGIEAQRQRR